MKGGIYPTKYGWRVYFGKISKRFKKNEHTLAERFLTGLRFKSDEGTLDLRDYQKDNPLGFANQVEKFLYSKRHLRGVKKYEQRLRHGVERWGNGNVKLIGYAEVEDLLNHLQDKGYSSKYRKDIRDCIRMFYKWLAARKEIKEAPALPVVKYSMAYRKLIKKDDQRKILDEIWNITRHFNPRICIGISFLATYINLRPDELRGIKEGHIDLERGVILIPKPKTYEPKYVYLLKEDIELLAENRMPAHPETYYFRHIKGNGNAKPGDQFGRDYLQRWWGKACKNLGIEGVPLYPGTRHSSAVDLRKRHSPEAVRRATMTKTNKAFERYLQITGDEVRDLYQDARTGNKLATNLDQYRKKKNQ
jgi:integrase